VTDYLRDPNNLATDDDLPGMWSHSDFTGGDPDERSYAERGWVPPVDRAILDAFEPDPGIARLIEIQDSVNASFVRQRIAMGVDQTEDDFEPPLFARPIPAEGQE
jgi:hypothetical protein